MSPAAPQPGPLNVLMVNTMLSLGGAGRVSELLAEGLRRAGDRVWGYGRIDPGRSPHNRRAGHWVEQRVAGVVRRRGLEGLVQATSLLWRVRAEYAAADVLHWHNLHGDYVSLLALPVWSRAKPVVWTLHDCWPLTGNCAAPHDCTRWRRGCGRCPKVGIRPQGPVDRSRFYRWLKPRLFRAARPRLVAPSRWLAEQVRAVPQLRRLPLRVIRNPIDCDLFRPQPAPGDVRARLGLDPGRPTVVMSGHDWDQPLKGGDLAVHALRAARERLPGLQLLVIGTRTERLLAAAGGAGRSLPPFQERAPLAEALGCADVCLFPSQAENYPNTVLEALACGTPVVACAVGGIPEQLEPGRSGLLVRAGDAGALAAALVQLAGDRDAARRMGRCGREFVLRTSAVPRVVAQYREEYGRALAAWRRRRGRASPRRQRGRLAVRIAAALGWEAPPAGGPGARAVRPSRPSEGEAGVVRASRPSEGRAARRSRPAPAPAAPGAGRPGLTKDAVNA